MLPSLISTTGSLLSSPPSPLATSSLYLKPLFPFKHFKWLSHWNDLLYLNFLSAWLSIFYQVQTNLNVNWNVVPILLKTWNEEGIHRNYYCEYHIIGTQIFGKLGAIIPSSSYLNHLSGTQSSSLLLSLSSGGPNHSHLDDITEEVCPGQVTLASHHCYYA